MSNKTEKKLSPYSNIYSWMTVEKGDQVILIENEGWVYITDTYRGKYGMRYHVESSNGAINQWVFENEFSIDHSTFVREETNQYGHPQYYENYFDWRLRRAEKHPVCPQCRVMVMPNRGEGTLCDSCAYEWLKECEKDYDEGELCV